MTQWFLYVIVITWGASPSYNRHPMESLELCQAAVETTTVTASAGEDELAVAVFCATKHERMWNSDWHRVELEE